MARAMACQSGSVNAAVQQLHGYTCLGCTLRYLGQMLGILRSLALPALLLVASQPALADEQKPRLNNRLAEVSAPPAPLVVQDYEPDPAMWLLGDEDTTLYFFGTYHVLPEGFRWRTPLLERVIAEADEIVFESRSDDDEEIDFAAIFGTREQILARPTISSRLSETSREKWRQLADEMELPFTIFDRIPPIMAIFAAALKASELKGSQSELGVETILENEFLNAGKPISAIEDAEQVFRNIIAIDEGAAIAMLETSLTEWDGEALFEFEDGEMVVDWSSEHAWAQGHLDAESIEELREDPFGEALYKVLLIDRNAAWAEWIANRLGQPGTVLIAVGAGHFKGPDSVQAMVAAKGLTIERMNPPAAFMSDDDSKASSDPVE